MHYLENLGLADHQTARISTKNDVKTMNLTPKFVTAFSDNHYEDAKKMMRASPNTFRRKNSQFTIWDWNRMLCNRYTVESEINI